MKGESDETGEPRRERPISPASEANKAPEDEPQEDSKTKQDDANASASNSESKHEKTKETENDTDDLTMEQHRAFADAIFEIGLESCSPTVIMSMMRNLPSFITRERTKSHLQKYRKASQKNKSQFLTEYDNFLKVVGQAKEKASPEPNEKPSPKDAMTTVLAGRNSEDLIGGEAAAFVTYTVANTCPANPHKSNIIPFRGIRTTIPILTEEEKKSSLGAEITHAKGLLTVMTDFILRTRQGFLTSKPTKKHRSTLPSPPLIPENLETNVKKARSNADKKQKPSAPSVGFVASNTHHSTGYPTPHIPHHSGMGPSLQPVYLQPGYQPYAPYAYHNQGPQATQYIVPPTFSYPLLPQTQPFYSGNQTAPYPYHPTMSGTYPPPPVVAATPHVAHSGPSHSISGHQQEIPPPPACPEYPVYYPPPYQQYGGYPQQQPPQALHDYLRAPGYDQLSQPPQPDHNAVRHDRTHPFEERHHLYGYKPEEGHHSFEEHDDHEMASPGHQSYGHQHTSPIVKEKASNIFKKSPSPKSYSKRGGSSPSVLSFSVGGPRSKTPINASPFAEFDPSLVWEPLPVSDSEDHETRRPRKRYRCEERLDKDRQSPHKMSKEYFFP